MQFMAYHSRERLVELFKECYDDHRDLKKVLDMITRKSGLVKRVLSASLYSAKKKCNPHLNFRRVATGRLTFLRREWKKGGAICYQAPFSD